MNIFGNHREVLRISDNRNVNDLNGLQNDLLDFCALAASIQQRRHLHDIEQLGYHHLQVDCLPQLHYHCFFVLPQQTNHLLNAATYDVRPVERTQHYIFITSFHSGGHHLISERVGNCRCGYSFLRQLEQRTNVRLYDRKNVQEACHVMFVREFVDLFSLNVATRRSLRR